MNFRDRKIAASLKRLSYGNHAKTSDFASPKSLCPLAWLIAFAWEPSCDELHSALFDAIALEFTKEAGNSDECSYNSTRMQKYLNEDNQHRMILR